MPLEPPQLFACREVPKSQSIVVAARERLQSVRRYRNRTHPIVMAMKCAHRDPRCHLPQDESLVRATRQGFNGARDWVAGMGLVLNVLMSKSDFKRFDDAV